MILLCTLSYYVSFQWSEDVIQWPHHKDKKEKHLSKNKLKMNFTSLLTILLDTFLTRIYESLQGISYALSEKM